MEANRESSNGLASLAGTWTEEELQSFEEAILFTEQIDEELWSGTDADSPADSTELPPQIPPNHG